MAQRRDLKGARFGKLTVLEEMKERQSGYVVWRCRCDCGKEILVNSRRLLTGTVDNCGCIERMTARRGNIAEDLSGRKFGRLTVLERVENTNGRTCWRCRCECGKEKMAAARGLKSGKVRSCGCLAREKGTNSIDLSGKEFGKLTALYPTEKRSGKGSVFWHCRCDCGNETDVTEVDLVHGRRRSCGCLKMENQKHIGEGLHRIDGTCVEILEKRKHRKDNKSGFRGVFQMKNGKYRVNIGFRGKKYYVGCFERYEEAVQMRLKMEQLMHERFIEAYHVWKEKADQDPLWEKEHPFQFELNWEKKAGDAEFGADSGCVKTAGSVSKK